MILGSMVAATFSRYREYRADIGGARLSGSENMISALEGLQSLQEIKDQKTDKPSYNMLKISTPFKRGLLQLFASHPPLEKRIERLKRN